MTSLLAELNRLFTEIEYNHLPAVRMPWTIKVEEVNEHETVVKAYFAVVGFGKDDINIEVNEKYNSFTLTFDEERIAELKHTLSSGNVVSNKIKIFDSNFTVSVNTKYDVSKLTATLENGLLVLTIPEVEYEKDTKRISIE